MQERPKQFQTASEGEPVQQQVCAIAGRKQNRNPPIPPAGEDGFQHKGTRDADRKSEQQAMRGLIVIGRQVALEQPRKGIKIGEHGK